jgi:hypothetical protein
MMISTEIYFQDDGVYNKENTEILIAYDNILNCKVERGKALPVALKVSNKCCNQMTRKDNLH